MIKYWPFWIATVVLIIALLVVITGHAPSPSISTTQENTVENITTDPSAAPPLRIGLIPERDIFAQRKRYSALCDYLQEKLNRPVKLVTANSYQAVLADFKDEQIDAAFLGSLVASLSFDRYQTQPIVKPEIADGVSTYTGVIFVRNNSPIRSIADLAGKSIAMVKTTTAGDLFPMFLLHDHGLYSHPNPPKIAWVGSHDDVVIQVMQGNVDAGAAKNLRIDAMEKAHKSIAIQRLASSKSVPNNALVLRKEVAQEIGQQLTNILLNMNQDENGREILTKFGAVRFLSCIQSEYAAIYDMTESLGSHWNETEIEGPAPRRPGSSK